MTIRECELDFTKPGAWSSTLVNANGGLHKMSGEVVSIDPPNAVEFTWGWHDEKDQRGAESLVRFEVTATGQGGTRFLLIHSGLTDAQSAESHGEGWASVLRQLERLVNAV